MALKMAYLAIYPLAVISAVGVGEVLKGAGRFGEVLGGAGRFVSWVLAIAVTAAAVQGVLAAPRPVPVVSLDLYHAGRWAREHLPPESVDYLVASADTAYWLHLAVMGQPRASARTAEVDAYEAHRALGRWVAGEGRPYAIADLALLPGEVRNRVTIAAQFGGAALIAAR